MPLKDGIDKEQGVAHWIEHPMGRFKKNSIFKLAKCDIHAIPLNFPICVYS
jgi:hypothetical protein